MAELELTARNLETAHQAFLVGGELSDYELKLLIAKYTRVADDLAFLGAHFHLAWKEADQRRQILQSFADHRQIS